MLAEARATGMGKKSNSCMANKDAVLRPLVSWSKALGVNNRLILSPSFFGCCEFQALLQRTDGDAPLKIELDGNDLGAGALILALAIRLCQAGDENKWVECRLLNFVTKNGYCKHVQ